MRPLHTIARDIKADIGLQMSARKKPGAVAPSWVWYSWPYLEAMMTLENVNQYYYADSAYGVVAYFLANAGPWKGPNSKALRAELKEHLNAKTFA